MLFLAGHPTRSYRVLANRQPEGIPITYLDLGISAHANYEWHCWVEADKLGFIRHTVGRTRAEAENKMLEFESDLRQAQEEFNTQRNAQKAL